MVTKFSGEVVISGSTRVRNQIQTSFLQNFVQYLQQGAPSNVTPTYTYYLYLLSGGNILATVPGTLTVGMKASAFYMQFTFVVPPMTTAPDSAQLYLSNNIGYAGVVAVADLVGFPVDKLVEVNWFIYVDISPDDYVTPYVLASLFGITSSPYPLPPNIQSGIEQYANVGLLTPDPTYTLTVSGTSINVTPVFTLTPPSFSVTYTAVPTSPTSYTGVALTATASAGPVTLFKSPQVVSVGVGQELYIEISAVWS